MCKILCSTGALFGTSNGGYNLLKSLSKLLLCDGYEFMLYEAWYEQTSHLLETIQPLELNIPVFHCDKNIGEEISKGNFTEAYRRFRINCFLAHELKARKLVVHLWNGLISDSCFENNLAAYPYLYEIAEKYNLELLIENIVCNISDPFTHWCTLHEKYPEIKFIFDTKMAAFHGQMDLLYSDKYSWLWKDSHLRHFHVNDYAGGYMEWSKFRTLPIGQGYIDFERFFGFIKEIGYQDTFTVESTAFNKSGAVDIDMLNEQFRYIREALK